jgi:hypothetical protein
LCGKTLHGTGNVHVVTAPGGNPIFETFQGKTDSFGRGIVLQDIIATQKIKISTCLKRQVPFVKGIERPEILHPPVRGGSPECISRIPKEMINVNIQNHPFIVTMGIIHMANHLLYRPVGIGEPINATVTSHTPQHIIGGILPGGSPHNIIQHIAQHKFKIVR